MKKAIDSFLAGRVIVSYGILVKLEVKTSDPNVRHGPGDLVHFNTENGVGAQKMVVVTASVMAPEWATPNELRLFLNGQTSSALTFGINAGTTPPCQPQSPGTFRFQKSARCMDHRGRYRRRNQVSALANRQTLSAGFSHIPTTHIQLHGPHSPRYRWQWQFRCCPGLCGKTTGRNPCRYGYEST